MIAIFIRTAVILRDRYVHRMMTYRVLFTHSLCVLCTLGALTLTSCSSSRTTTDKQPSPKSNRTAKGGATLNQKKLPSVTPQKSLSSSQTPFLTPLHQRIVAEAESWIGVPYSYGGTTRLGVDCSALILNIYSALGLILPRTAAEQFEFGTIIPHQEILLPGDLIFFNTAGHPASHVGIISGPDEFIHASSSIGVTKQKLTDSYFAERRTGLRRILSLPKPKTTTKLGSVPPTTQAGKGE
jgi:cell wall-associated NlpC family hydrolase